jgi:hypothetical protein
MSWSSVLRLAEYVHVASASTWVAQSKSVTDMTSHIMGVEAHHTASVVDRQVGVVVLHMGNERHGIDEGHRLIVIFEIEKAFSIARLTSHHRSVSSLPVSPGLLQFQ